MKVFFLLLLLVSCALDKNETRKSAEFVATKDIIQKKINQSESQFDVKCWTTSKNISNLMFGFQTDDRAFHIRENLISDFTLGLWRYAQNLNPDRKTLNAKNIREAFELLSRVAIKKEKAITTVQFKDGDAKTGKLADPLTITELDFFDYRRTSNSWKTLYNLTLLDPGQTFLQSDLTEDAVEALAEFTDIYAIVLIKKSIEAAKKDGQNIVLERHFKDKNSTYLTSASIGGWKPTGDYAPRAYAQALNYGLLKISNLEYINKKIPEAEIKKVYSIIAGKELTENGYQELKNTMKDLTELLWRRAQDKNLPESYLVSGLSLFDATQEILPYRTDDLSNVIFFHNTNAPLLYQEFESDTVRDDGYHWKIISELLSEKGKKQKTDDKSKLMPLDVYAAEELTEVVSNYVVPLLKKASEISGSNVDRRHIKESHKFYLSYLTRHKPVELKTALISTNLPYKDTDAPLFRDATDEVLLKPFQNPEVIENDVMNSSTLMAFDAFRGVSTADFNQDGWPDLFIAHEGGKSVLYLNNNGKNFSDNTQSSGLEGITGITGANPIDYNNDGCIDLYLVRPYISSLLYQNDCHGKFTDMTESVGLFIKEIPTTGSIWFDADNDGWPDLYVLSTGDFRNGFLPMFGDFQNALPNRFFHNQKGKKFIEKTDSTGLGDRRISLAAAAVDVDNDNDLDVYVVNDMQRNMLFENKGNLKFVEVSKKSQTDDLGNGMGVSVADLNQDSLLDMFVTNVNVWNPKARYIRPDRSTKFQSTKELDRYVRSRPTNRLYMNAGNKVFKESFAEKMQHFNVSSWGWNNFFFDFDNDELTDLYVVNGFRPESFNHHDEEKLLVKQTPDGSFHQLPHKISQLGYKSNSRGSVFLDFDKDGDMDLVLTGLHSPKFYLNEDQQKNNWVAFNLKGKKSNRSGFGSRITVKTDTRSQSLQQGAIGGHFISYINGPVHFGLGKNKLINEVTVKWPSGQKTVLKNLEANRIVDIEE